MALDPDSIECDRHERLADKFDDEARVVADALDCFQRDRVKCVHTVRDILDGIATIRFSIDLDVVATLGEVEDRFELLVNEMLAALPENARRAAKSRNDLAEFAKQTCIAAAKAMRERIERNGDV